MDPTYRMGCNQRRNYDYWVGRERDATKAIVWEINLIVRLELSSSIHESQVRVKEEEKRAKRMGLFIRLLGYCAWQRVSDGGWCRNKEWKTSFPDCVSRIRVMCSLHTFPFHGTDAFPGARTICFSGIVGAVH